MTTQKTIRPARAAKRAPSASRTAVAKASSARPRRHRATAVTPDPSHVAERAYYLSLAGGEDAVANWLRAERELAAAA